MKCIDLSHTIETGMPVYPGTETPSIQEATSVATHGYKESLLHFFSHVGTHIDMPAHLFENATTTESATIDNFFGKAVLIDCTTLGKNSSIDIPHLLNYKKQIEEADIVVLKTGWSKYWGNTQYFDEFPVLSYEAACFLRDSKLKIIGIDAISVDRVGDNELPNHRIFLPANTYILENLTNLENIPCSFTMSCFPLKIKNGDGSPVRAIAFFTNTRGDIEYFGE